MKDANSLMSSLGTTVFEVMSALARQHQSVNLGQGFPDDKGPEEVRRAAAEYLLDGHNQYPPMMGIPELRQAVAAHAKRFQDLDIDWQSEVLVTSGATEALGDCLFGLIEPGDEVVLIEPLYDSYLPIVRRAGGVPKLVRLEPPTWRLPREELAAAFSERTKLILFNTPMNPCSKVFDRDELEFIAGLCVKHDAYAVCDEVYEHLTLGDACYVSIATLPDIFERTVTVSSVGKSFSATGWKIGWVYGQPALVEGVLRAHQFITFSIHHPSQQAVAYALNLPDSYFTEFRATYEAKCQLLISSMEGSGLRHCASEGTYFLMADFSDVFKGTPQEFAHYLIKEIGVACIPPETFYSPQHVDICKNYVRFSFCKTDEVLVQVKERLARLAKDVPLQ